MLCTPTLVQFTYLNRVEWTELTPHLLSSTPSFSPVPRPQNHAHTHGCNDPKVRMGRPPEMPKALLVRPSPRTRGVPKLHRYNG